MRYLKTYESFSTNEEFLGGLWNKISSAFANWKNEKLKNAGEKLAKAIEEKKDQPILYLPKYSYFGDYQILYNLKSNLLFKTLAHTPEDKKNGVTEQLPDIIFMCCSNEHLLEFCDLFPQTAENIKRRSLQRRKKFMEQKNTNSKKYNEE